jgi:glycopeptide antibiotics resistance protein
MKWPFRVAVVLSAAVVLAIDYPWGDFTGHTHWSNVRWVPFVTPPVEPADVFQNILMLIPLGFSAAFPARSPARGIAGAALVGLPVAVLGEWTQLYSHGRFPSATDVAANVIGAVTGAVWARWLRLPARD